jgi:hypothetical protein
MLEDTWFKVLLIGVILAGFRGSSVQAQGEPLNVMVTPSHPWNVTGDDMARLRAFYHGVGFEFEPTDAVAQGLREIGVQRLRLINIDGTLKQVREDGSVEIEWSPHLEGQLAYCRQWGFTPHLIIGQVLQPAVAEGAPGDQRLESHWPAYEKYVYAFFDHVLREHGFADAYWEVANEPDINGAAWLTKATYPNGAWLGLKASRPILSPFSSARPTSSARRCRYSGMRCPSR